MKRTRLKPKLYASIRAKTWLSIFIVLIPTIMMASLFWYGNQVDKMIAIKPVYAQVPTYQFIMPELAPLPEREQNIELIKKIWGKDREIGLAIAKCESGYRTKATHYNTNNTVDQGIFQMNSIHNIPEMDSAVANISTAYLMYQQQGTNPWNSSKGCWGN